MNPIHYSSKIEEWISPPEIIQAVINTLGFIDLDPCSNSEGRCTVPARSRFTKNEDGLKLPWFGRVYVNPPYGRTIRKWISKAIHEYDRGVVSEVVILVPARTDTRWFNSLNGFIWCAIRGRLRFSGMKDAAPFPSAVFYLGDHRLRFYSAFEQLGPIYRSVGMWL